MNQDFFRIKIKDLRHQLGLNEDEMAELLGLSSAHIHNIEAGRSFISFETLVQISDVLDVRPGTLLDSEIDSVPIYDEALNEKLNSLSKEQISAVTKALEAFLAGE